MTPHRSTPPCQVIGGLLPFPHRTRTPPKCHTLTRAPSRRRFELADRPHRAITPVSCCSRPPSAASECHRRRGRVPPSRCHCAISAPPWPPMPPSPGASRETRPAHTATMGRHVKLVTKPWTERLIPCRRVGQIRPIGHLVAL
jgi:hypothetical protein